MTSRLYVNTMGTGRRSKAHKKSDSEALADLESVLQDVDIDGEASFLTSLRILGVKLPETEMALIFKELDEEETGMIEYEKVLKFMKMGKIPSTLLNRIKSKNAPKRKSILFNAGGQTPEQSLKVRTFNSNNNNNNNGDGNTISSALFPESPPRGGLLPIVNEKLAMIQTQMKLLNPQRLKMIQRAVIVIKKAAMKKIKRPEVVDFLIDKGMSVEDIDLAFVKAQEQVMTPEERLKSIQELADARLNQVLEQQRINAYLTSEMRTHTQEIDILRDLLQLSVKKLLTSYSKKFPEELPKEAADQLTEKMQQTKRDVSRSQSAKDDRALRIYRRDLQTLNTLSNCVMEQQHFHAYICMHGLDESFRETMPELLNFLSNYRAIEEEEEDEYQKEVISNEN